ncbi:hypothetical protein L6452_31370 [Arctium lappa]|uniref:Uncharacterized protein n=1 Tax=Arctium lappa TaxID=4217 RepID=A0ACB8Z0R4_ARCLA|nr:hypothetical protein L6452_31370 [Arctium lappa]
MQEIVCICIWFFPYEISAFHIFIHKQTAQSSTCFWGLQPQPQPQPQPFSNSTLVHLHQQHPLTSFSLFLSIDNNNNIITTNISLKPRFRFTFFIMEEDSGDGSMICTDHPFKNNTPAGGICAFCLQEKLGKLVSSSFPIAVFPAASSSSSSPNSFRSAAAAADTTTISLSNPHTTSLLPNSNTTTTNHHHSSSNPSRILYLLTSQKKKKNKDLNNDIIVDKNHHHHHHHLVFKRSKSTATPRPHRFMDDNNNNKRGFWSFLYLPKHSHKTITTSNPTSSSSFPPPPQLLLHRSRRQDNKDVQENESPCQASFDRKVSRSRSVGCGSRSFSGDFFERISTGFGDCTLRRVESQREGKSKVSGGQDCIKERVRCGGLFSGFMITSSSSSSSSSSYWVGSNPNIANVKGPAVAVAVAAAASGGAVQHSRSKSWGWGLASPMRAFNKTSSSSKREKHNPTPNLGAIPSLLSVRS